MNYELGRLSLSLANVTKYPLQLFSLTLSLHICNTKGLHYYNL